MDKKQVQIFKSILAIVGCIVFLWTGKKFIWNQDSDKTVQSAENSAPVTEVTDLTGVTTSDTTTSVTSTVVSSDVTSSVETSTTVSQSSVSAVSSSATALSSSDAAPASSAATSTSADAVTPDVPRSDGMTDAPEGYFDDALFIGDSRMVGLACFAPIKGATYFASTGLSSFKIDTAESEIQGTNDNPGTKGMKLDDVLKMKQFSKVYLMLGINELGCDRGIAKQKYMDLYVRIRNAFPNATIYIMANLHVSHKRADKDSIVNNKEINDYNSYLESLADKQVSYYLDVNPLFDAADGYLKEDWTNDGVHPFAKHYAIWRDYLTSHVVLK